MTVLLNYCLCRTSFDRFCDDLQLELLQYLHLPDKIRLESVSKQWKRVIFSKQFDLEIDDTFCDGIPNWEKRNKLQASKLMAFYDCGKYPELNGVTIIQRLLTKCNGISHIIIGDIYFKEKTISFNQLICTIADYCHKLQSLEYKSLPSISENVWEYFGAKRGNGIKKFNDSGSFIQSHLSDYKPILKYCENCLSLTNIRLKHLIIEDYILVPKLVEFEGYECERTDLLELFVNRYKNTLKSFNTFFNAKYGKITSFLQQLSLLYKLSDLHLLIREIDFNVFNENFNKCVTNWNQLTHLDLDLRLNNDTFDLPSYKKVFKIFNKCSKLICLNLEIKDYKSFKNQHSVLQNFLLGKSLKNCTQLSCLRIELNPIDDSIFADIEKYLPNLNWINISGYNKNLTDCTMKSLSKLKQLKGLEIYGYSVITDSGINDVLVNCLHFNSLVLEESELVTSSTIDNLIELARKNPKQLFKHYLLSCKSEIVKEILIYKLSLFPQNLKIKTDSYTYY